MPKTSRVAVLLLAAGLCTSGAACAARTYPYRRGDVYHQELFERRAYDNGYREGLEHGRDDARRHRSRSYSRHDEYRDANQGDDRDDGRGQLYRNAYREGFRAGYLDGFSRFSDAFARPGPR